MKANNLLITFIVVLGIITDSYSQEVEFKASRMDVKDNGNIIFAYDSETIIADKNINIISNKVKYSKDNDILVFTDDVIIEDKENNVKVISNEIIYEKKKDLIYSLIEANFMLMKNMR